VVVANLSPYSELMNSNPLEHGLKDFCIEIKNYIEVFVLGQDSHTFLNGQITTNVDLLLPNTFDHFSRLDSKGRVKFSGYVLRQDKKISLLIKNDQIKFAIEDLNKYIISEDVEIVENKSRTICFNSKSTNKSSSLAGLYNYIPGFLSFDEAGPIHEHGVEVFSFYEFLTSGKSTLFPETIFSLNSNHFTKGCFVGQEIVSKIENNRGARKLPVVLQVKDLNALYLEPNEGNVLHGENDFGDLCKTITFGQIGFLLVEAKREFQIFKESLPLVIGSSHFSATVYPLSNWLSKNFSNLSNDFFISGVDLLNNNFISLAEKHFALSLLINPKNIDSLEAIGVLFGRNKKYSLAHQMMNELIRLNPGSVMAHTNKSLFFMNEGKIDEAEHEKELALQKSLKANTSPETIEAKEEKIKRKNDQLKNQLDMYSEVLEIDPDDEFAIEKWLEINYELHNFSQMKEFLILKNTSENLIHFIWLHKALKALGCNLEAVEKQIPGMLSKALKLGDLKSVNYLKSHC
jgi:folate-binding Fe-S cluster repair protein YgfZ